MYKFYSFIVVCFIKTQRSHTTLELSSMSAQSENHVITRTMTQALITQNQKLRCNACIIDTREITVN